MAGVNRVIILGNLGADVEVRYTGDSVAVANFTIAVSETWIDKATQTKKEKVEWCRIVVFGKLAEQCGKYLSKGSQAYVEGSLQTRSWEDKQGVKKYITEVKASTVQFLGSKGEEKAGSNQGSAKQEVEDLKANFDARSIPF